MRKHVLLILSAALAGAITGTSLIAFALGNPSPSLKPILSKTERSALTAKFRIIFLDDVIEFQVNRDRKYDFRGKVPAYVRIGAREA
ncbi:hypothetical protein [Rhodoligotrophos ferricapiens]|uniref:hypothetical protein n=1 Tax=Rhodoligotrophos ferricapiens TaxID=3069264 RepID=UPI00315C70AF